MLQNGNFSNGWETLPAIENAGFLRNQRPNGWQIEWLAVGAPLYDDPNSKVGGIPECLHKLNKQLPKNEQLGEKDALILAGDANYKIFSATAPFGATLSQTVTGLLPGAEGTLTVPIQVHYRDETDAFGAESGVWVNDEGGWVNCFDMGDRRWYKHEVKFVVPENGQAEIVIRVKSKWPKPKDFFFDDVTLDVATAKHDDENDDPETVTKTVRIELPPGVELKRGTSNMANTIEVNVGPGVRIDVI